MTNIHGISSTVEPHYNEVLGTMKITLVISGFSLYQGKKNIYIRAGTRKIKEEKEEI